MVSMVGGVVYTDHPAPGSRSHVIPMLPRYVEGGHLATI